MPLHQFPAQRSKIFSFENAKNEQIPATQIQMQIFDMSHKTFWDLLFIFLEQGFKNLAFFRTRK